MEYKSAGWNLAHHLAARHTAEIQQLVIARAISGMHIR
jgi:hypothetical protein